MDLEIKFDVANEQTFRKHLQDVLQVAAVKAWEAAVERAPARGEGPYSTGRMRESIRFKQTGPYEYTLYCPISYGIFNEFGTGPKGRATGAVREFPNDPQPSMNYHSGEVLVTRHRGQLLDEPYIRHTQGMQAQPFMRPALLEGVKWIKKLLSQ